MTTRHAFADETGETAAEYIRATLLSLRSIQARDALRKAQIIHGFSGAALAEDHPDWVSWRRAAETPSIHRDSILLAQIRRKEEAYAGAVIADPIAVDLLADFSTRPLIDIVGLGEVLSAPEVSVALAKLFRANYVEEVGDSLAVTSAGKQELQKWQTATTAR